LIAVKQWRSNVRLRQTAAPQNLAVSLAEARRQCAISDSTHDDLLVSLIDAATSHAEKYLDAFIADQAVEITFESFPEYLHLYPVKSVDSVKYDDADGAEQTLSTDLYEVQLDGFRPEIRPKDAWPALSNAKQWPVRIACTVGFDTVPNPIKQAILVMVQEMYSHRGDSITGTMVSPSSFTARRLLDGYRRMVL
jgi:uncharacterized phiE125 gp8 family phage protein